MRITYSHFISISINFGRLIYLQFYRQPLSFRITRCREKSSSRYDINFDFTIFYYCNKKKSSANAQLLFLWSCARKKIYQDRENRCEVSSNVFHHSMILLTKILVFKLFHYTHHTIMMVFKVFKVQRQVEIKQYLKNPSTCENSKAWHGDKLLSIFF